jgi:hypothetical protein
MLAALNRKPTYTKLYVLRHLLPKKSPKHEHYYAPRRYRLWYDQAVAGQIFLSLVIILPLLLGLIFRVSTSHVFFSLMAGELLGRYFGHDIEKFAHGFMKNVDLTGYGEIFLMAAPMVLTAFFLKNTISKGRLVLHVIPLLITGVIFAAFVGPLLQENLKQGIEAVPAGEKFLHLHRIIIGGMVGLQLLSLWFLTRKEKGEGKHKE